jgi:hypothetical protein
MNRMSVSPDHLARLSDWGGFLPAQTALCIGVERVTLKSTAARYLFEFYAASHVPIFVGQASTNRINLPTKELV